VVLVAGADDTYLHCLTTDAILRTFDSATADSVSLWSDVDPALPETEMVLFAPPTGTVYTDVIMRPAEGPVRAFRVDTEVDPDPLYRAAATAVTDGALTFMNWFEYEGVVEDGQGNIVLVQVDSGDGCVTPSPETIADGSYPYTQSGLLIVNMTELSRLEVQSFLWYLADDSNYPALESAGLLGVAFGDLPAFRDNLQTLFAEAAALSLQPSVEATPESTPDVDAESTPEASPEATPEATEESS
jgi:phosphate transport system substrate-binding protein